MMTPEPCSSIFGKKRPVEPAGRKKPCHPEAQVPVEMLRRAAKVQKLLHLRAGSNFRSPASQVAQVAPPGDSRATSDPETA